MLNDQIILEELSNDAGTNVLPVFSHRCGSDHLAAASLLPRCTIPDSDSHNMLELSLGRWKQSVFSFHLCPRLEDA